MFIDINDIYTHTTCIMCISHGSRNTAFLVPYGMLELRWPPSPLQTTTIIILLNKESHVVTVILNNTHATKVHVIYIYIFILIYIYLYMFLYIIVQEYEIPALLLSVIRLKLYLTLGHVCVTGRGTRAANRVSSQTVDCVVVKVSSRKLLLCVSILH